MSTTPVDFETMLRAAVEQVRHQAPGALDDLLRCSSRAASAVAGVTGGQAILELVPLETGEGPRGVYQLQMRRSAGEAPPSDLGVYRLGEAGYPIRRWHARHAWEEQPDRPRDSFADAPELEAHFRWLVSSPESRLVVLVTFFQGQAGKPASGT